MNHRLLHRWAREEALPLPSRTHPQTQKQTWAVYTEELTDLTHSALNFPSRNEQHFACVSITIRSDPSSASSSPSLVIPAMSTKVNDAQRNAPLTWRINTLPFNDSKSWIAAVRSIGLVPCRAWSQDHRTPPRPLA
jgi:hypothetical protein